MKKRLTHVSPVQCGTVLAVLYGLFSLLIVPFFLLGTFLSMHAPRPAQAPHNPFDGGLGIGFAIAIPVIYAILGFIFGILGALIYNLVARITGGIEFKVTDIPEAIALE